MVTKKSYLTIKRCQITLHTNYKFLSTVWILVLLFGQAGLLDFKGFYDFGFSFFAETSKSDKQCIHLHLESPQMLFLHFIPSKDCETGISSHHSISGSYILEYESRAGAAKVCRTKLWELDILSGKYVWKAVGFLFTHMPLSGFALLQCQ